MYLYFILDEMSEHFAYTFDKETAKTLAEALNDRYPSSNSDNPRFSYHEADLLIIDYIIGEIEHAMNHRQVTTIRPDDLRPFKKDK